MNRTQKTVAAIFIGLMLVAGAGCTTTKPTQLVQTEADWKFHDTVDLDIVKQYAKVPMDENVMIIDARPKRAKYNRGHIPMAVSIPNTRFDKMTDKLPRDKNALLIFYCGGTHCKLSHKSAHKAEKLGYTNVKVFAEGFPKWMEAQGHYASVSAGWMKKQIDNNTDMTVVDARPRRKKYDKGHIPTAISIPDMKFDKMKDRLPEDKNSLLVFYCGGLKCKLSHKSAAKAIKLGYTNVKVFSEGYPAWKKVAGTTTTDTPKVTLKAGKEEGSIEIDQFKKIMAENPKSIYLVDVRDADEFSKGTLKSAVNIPVDNLEDKIKELPVNKPIVFICGTGARSGESYYMVKDIRPDIKEVYYLDAELTIKKDGSFTIKVIDA